MRVLGMNKAAVMALTAGFIVSGAMSAQAQSKPKSPAEIAEVSKEQAEKNNKCRLEANEQKLHAIKRQKFLHECRKQP